MSAADARIKELELDKASAIQAVIDSDKRVVAGEARIKELEAEVHELESILHGKPGSELARRQARVAELEAARDRAVEHSTDCESRMWKSEARVATLEAALRQAAKDLLNDPHPPDAAIALIGQALGEPTNEQFSEVNYWFALGPTEPPTK